MRYGAAVFVFFFLMPSTPLLSQDLVPLVWRVDSKTGCKLKVQCPAKHDMSWSGDCASGYAEGKGTFRCADDEDYSADEPSAVVYVGEFSKGSFEGHGTVSDECTKYTGDFVAGRAHGVGTDELLCSDVGEKYVGEWKNGKKHGIGVMIDENGKKIAGTWVEGIIQKPASSPANSRPQPRE